MEHDDDFSILLNETRYLLDLARTHWRTGGQPGMTEFVRLESIERTLAELVERRRIKGRESHGRDIGNFHH